MSARAFVTSVSLSPTHSFSKTRAESIRLLAGLGVEGDAHCGELIQHVSRVKKNPAQPNLRQVHLMHCELFTELAAKGFQVGAGDLGENITTQNLKLPYLLRNSLLHIGPSAVVRLTGVRTPCDQLNQFRPGLFDAVIERLPDDTTFIKSGVMGVVLAEGVVRPGDEIRLEFPPKPWIGLDKV